MVFRRYGMKSSRREAAPVWQVFLGTQKATGEPQGIVFQSEHARLSGQIAADLRPDIFGELPDDVLAAISGHDAGWQRADEDMLATPMPFLRVPGEQANEYWRESVRMAEERSALAGVVVSRHFCALATSDESHRSFREREEPRREVLESVLGIPGKDLDRYTSAIGFCDVVSLYLCSGAADPVLIPLAHPALASAALAQKVVLEWIEGQPRFSLPVMRPGAVVSAITARPGDVLSWRF